MNAYVLERVSKVLGVNHFMVARMASSGRLTEEQWQRMDRRNKRLDWDDVEALARRCRSCEEIGAQANTRVDVKRGREEIIGLRLSGVTANMAIIEDKTVEEGRFLLPHEVEHPALVCVLGMDVRNRFFPGTEALGRTVRLRGIDFRVVGVEARRG